MELNGCCDRHPDTSFHIQNYFAGRFLYDVNSSLFYGDVDDPARQQIVTPAKKRKAGPKTRATKDRAELVKRLYDWRWDAAENDEDGDIRSPSCIIDNSGISTLSKIYPTEITTEDELVSVLSETVEWRLEWAGKILGVIRKYDGELTTTHADNEARKKRAKEDATSLAFREESARIEERARQDALRRFQALSSVPGPASQTSAVLQPISQNIPVNSAPGMRRSARQAQKNK